MSTGLHEAKGVGGKKVVVVQETREFKKWLESLYNPKLLDEDELMTIYDQIKYKGFDRNDILVALFEKFKDDIKLISEIIIVCALNGPVRASETTLSNGRSLSSMGIPASKKQRTKDISCARITASTADLAAFYLKRIPNLPKKIQNHPLPAWLQFPSAAAIEMPDHYREMHKDFSKLFSEKIKPKDMKDNNFNEEIYETIKSNSYLNKKLNLFE
jgi:hypothetical protein